MPIPAYGAMQREPQLGSWMLEILLEGVSTREYPRALPPMAETAGVSRSSVRRQAIEGWRIAGEGHPSRASLRGAHSMLRLVKIREVNQQQAQKVEACAGPERYRQSWAGDTWL